VPVLVGEVPLEWWGHLIDDVRRILADDPESLVFSTTVRQRAEKIRWIRQLALIPPQTVPGELRLAELAWTADPAPDYLPSERVSAISLGSDGKLYLETVSSRDRSRDDEPKPPILTYALEALTKERLLEVMRDNGRDESYGGCWRLGRIILAALARLAHDSAEALSQRLAALNDRAALIDAIWDRIDTGGGRPKAEAL
jgi:hypothetical protein